MSTIQTDNLKVAHISALEVPLSVTACSASSSLSLENPPLLHLLFISHAGNTEAVSWQGEALRLQNPIIHCFFVLQTTFKQVREITSTYEYSSSVLHLSFQLKRMNYFSVNTNKNLITFCSMSTYLYFTMKIR